MLLYRQLAPNPEFDGAVSLSDTPMVTPETVINQVDRPEILDPKVIPKDNLWYYITYTYIGDYALRGKYCSVNEFEQTGCGYQSTQYSLIRWGERPFGIRIAERSF